MERLACLSPQKPFVTLGLSLSVWPFHSLFLLEDPGEAEAGLVGVCVALHPAEVAVGSWMGMASDCRTGYF
jgi:hypothetical protein